MKNDSLTEMVYNAAKWTLPSNTLKSHLNMFIDHLRSRNVTVRKEISEPKLNIITEGLDFPYCAKLQWSVTKDGLLYGSYVLVEESDLKLQGFEMALNVLLQQLTDVINEVDT